MNSTFLKRINVFFKLKKNILCKNILCLHPIRCRLFRCTGCFHRVFVVCTDKYWFLELISNQRLDSWIVCLRMGQQNWATSALIANACKFTYCCSKFMLNFKEPLFWFTLFDLVLLFPIIIPKHSITFNSIQFKIFRKTFPGFFFHKDSQTPSIRKIFSQQKFHYNSRSIINKQKWIGFDRNLI